MFLWLSCGSLGSSLLQEFNMHVVTEVLSCALLLAGLSTALGAGTDTEEDARGRSLQSSDGYYGRWYFDWLVVGAIPHDGGLDGDDIFLKVAKIDCSSGTMLSDEWVESPEDKGHEKYEDSYGNDRINAYWTEDRDNGNTDAPWMWFSSYERACFRVQVWDNDWDGADDFLDSFEFLLDNTKRRGVGPGTTLPRSWWAVSGRTTALFSGDAEEYGYLVGNTANTGDGFVRFRASFQMPKEGSCGEGFCEVTALMQEMTSLGSYCGALNVYNGMWCRECLCMADYITWQTELSCNAGEYISGTSCQDCPLGRYSSGGTATSCTLCAAGKYGTSTTSPSGCRTCPQGTYASYSGSTTCQTCPSGRYSLSGSDSYGDCQLSCSAGTFQSTTSTCSYCPIGRYNSATRTMNGPSSCTACPSGMTTSTTGADSYYDCRSSTTNGGSQSGYSATSGDSGDEPDGAGIGGGAVVGIVAGVVVAVGAAALFVYRKYAAQKRTSGDASATAGGAGGRSHTVTNWNANPHVLAQATPAPATASPTPIPCPPTTAVVPTPAPALSTLVTSAEGPAPAAPVPVLPRAARAPAGGTLPFQYPIVQGQA